MPVGVSNAGSNRSARSFARANNAGACDGSLAGETRVLTLGRDIEGTRDCGMDLNGKRECMYAEVEAKYRVMVLGSV